MRLGHPVRPRTEGPRAAISARRCGGLRDCDIMKLTASKASATAGIGEAPAREWAMTSRTSPPTTPRDWPANRARAQQKDVDAVWTLKVTKAQLGKDPSGASTSRSRPSVTSRAFDQPAHGIIRRGRVTDAAHDGPCLRERLVDPRTLPPPCGRVAPVGRDRSFPPGAAAGRVTYAVTYAVTYGPQKGSRA